MNQFQYKLIFAKLLCIHIELTDIFILIQAIRKSQDCQPCARVAGKLD